MSEKPQQPENKREKKTVVSIKTFGCQMNAYDSEVASGLLEGSGYTIIKDDCHSERSDVLEGKLREGSSSLDPSATPQDDMPDVYIMNTCSVREHAEDKVYSRLGMLSKIKKTKPELIIGLMGCMVEEHRERLFKRFPALDLMVGTRNIKELPALIDEVRKTRQQISRIKQDGISIEYTDQIKRKGTYHAWLPVMTGCDKVCTYCIVPITRGREVSMPAREVYREASRLVEDGVKWITLLGQNVNSYNGAVNSLPPVWGKVGMGGENQQSPPPLSSPIKGEEVRFPQLLQTLCGIKGLERISFTTSHPHDATDELFQVIARNPKVSRRFHLPLQSGSDRMLKRMKRLHTLDDFKEKIWKLRSLVKDISVTTDIIAGFSGETEEDHEETIKALCQIRFDSAYIYKYSIRAATPAAKLPDDVPLKIKDARNHNLLLLQKRITSEINRDQIGKVISVYAEKRSTKDATKLIGRTEHDKKVLFEGDDSLIDRFISVELTDMHHETFVGKVLSF